MLGLRSMVHRAIAQSATASLWQTYLQSRAQVACACVQLAVPTCSAAARGSTRRACRWPRLADDPTPLYEARRLMQSALGMSRVNGAGCR